MATTTVSEIGLLELAGTCFENLDDGVAERLLARSKRVEVRAGAMVFRASDSAEHVALVLSGTVRSFMTGANGRQLTLRYARRGVIVGKYATAIGAHAPLGVQALTDCTILEFDPNVFRSLLATEVGVANAIVMELAHRLEDVYATVGDSAFGSIRQRLVRHLLLLATEGDPDSGYFATITQQQLANAIGSSREVVARELGRMREEQLVRTAGGVVELLSVDRLATSLGHWQADSPY